MEFFFFTRKSNKFWLDKDKDKLKKKKRNYDSNEKCTNQWTKALEIGYQRYKNGKKIKLATHSYVYTS